ncbi:DEAD-box (RNA) helicase, putative [Theileria annulata]|uniref:RNA helicase n=1 Tax=Theileria annulata TaxID=5874 RepID=Q4UCL5_THEAN|nr:DEAD-box (RNA) helicase, putative [Theileria annulata]CAI75436.1 DEAD-box (RNA) helicase, putative [Theileria annulata]|eukprot:XP_954912.1 DEAD-box (RNA) helicase, putative [Theileria annulata]
MDKIFKKLVKGTNFKNGPSSGVFVFRDGNDKEADSGVFDEDSSVVYASGEDFKDYTPLDSFSSLDSLTTDEMMSQRAKFISNSIKSKFNFDKSTPIQRYVIPIMMKGNDVVAVAPTEIGRSSECYNNCADGGVGTASEIRICENFSIATLEKNMKSFNFSIAVTTPLTLYTLLHTNTINTSMTGLKCVILDECDKLLEEGYSENIEYVMNHLKDFKGIQKASFSSTVQSEVLLLSKSHFNNPIHITIGKENVCCCNVEQELICVTNDKGKLVILKQLINDGKLLPPILVFLQSVNRVNDLYNELSQLNLNVQKFTKQLTLKQRQNIIQKFRIGQIWILLCTDILCRGINFKGVHSIVNYDLPLTPQVYINRVGRAGRGTRRGKSVTFFTINDFKILNHIVQIMKLSKSNVPNYLLTLKNIDIQGIALLTSVILY